MDQECLLNSPKMYNPSWDEESKTFPGLTLHGLFVFCIKTCRDFFGKKTRNSYSQVLAFFNCTLVHVDTHWITVRCLFIYSFIHSFYFDAVVAGKPVGISTQ